MAAGHGLTAPADDPGVTMTTPAGPSWDDPRLNDLARDLRAAHARVAALPDTDRPRMTRHLLIITDLAKRDPELAIKRLESFIEDLDSEENVL